jgi:alpha-1,6-mannosyltransferase
LSVHSPGQSDNPTAADASRASVFPRALAIAAGLMFAAHALLIWATFGLTHANATSLRAVAPLIVGLGLPAAVGLYFAPLLADITPARLALGIVFAAGLAMRLIWFTVPAPLEDDFNRYMWDGAVMARGLNPYTVAPADYFEAPPPAGYSRMNAVLAGPLAETSRTVLKGINFPDVRTIYPTVAQIGFAIGHWLAPLKLNGLRFVFLMAELATFVLLLHLLATMAHSPLWSTLYWWNPLAAFATIGIAHVDALVPPFVLGALAMAHVRRFEGAVALLALGAGVKIWPVMLVPLIVAPMLLQQRRLVTVCLVFGATLAFAVGPLLLSTLQPGSGLSAYASGWSNHNAFYAWATELIALLPGEYATWQRLLSASLALVTLVVAGLVALRITPRAGRPAPAMEHLVTGALIIAATVFYLSPAQFPWYAVWFLPLAALVRSWPLLLASATLPLYYLFFTLWESGRGNNFFYGTSFLHALPVLGWLAWDWSRRTPLSGSKP